jgi:5-formyltetrahydrofolate cyclo-ligase
MPIPSQLVRAKDIAIMLIPLITFDQNGHRVGYGKGFYDQYLAKCSPNLLKIGLSIFDEISVIDDLESTDIPLDVIITPTGLSCIGKMSNSY